MNAVDVDVESTSERAALAYCVSVDEINKRQINHDLIAPGFA